MDGQRLLVHRVLGRGERPAVQLDSAQNEPLPAQTQRAASRAGVSGVAAQGAGEMSEEVKRLLRVTSESLELAIEQMKDAISLFPQDTDVHLSCAKIYSDAERFDEAITCLSQVTETDPVNIMASKLLGEIYIKKGDREKAWVKYLNVLDDMLLDMNSDDAIMLLDSFKDIDPIETRKRLVTLYRQSGENQKAARELTSLGNAYTEKGMQREGVNCYREALLITPDDDSVRKKIADLEQEIRAAHISSREKKTADEAISEAEVFLQYGLYDDAQSLLDVLRRKARRLSRHRRLNEPAPRRENSPWTALLRPRPSSTQASVRAMR